MSLESEEPRLRQHINITDVPKVVEIVLSCLIFMASVYVVYFCLGEMLETVEK